MIKSAFACLLLSVLSASAATIGWGPLSISDNNGGNFIAGFINTDGGANYNIALPNFSQSDFATFDGEVNFGISVSANAAITGITFFYTGLFDETTSGDYSQTAGALSDSNALVSSILPAPFVISGAPLSVDLTSLVRLFARDGGSASVSNIRITVVTADSSVPEPSTFLLLSLPLALLAFRRKHLRMLPIVALCLVSASAGWSQQSVSSPAAAAKKRADDPLDRMSSMGQIAQAVSNYRSSLPAGSPGRSFRLRANLVLPPKPDECDKNDEDCSNEGVTGEGPGGGQAEMAIAVDPTGQHIVVGFNDTRGFSRSPISVSGYAYSDDGGATFQDGGQLPAAATGNVGTTAYPQVFGDADIKFVPGGAGCQFIYSSIFVKGLGTAPTYTGTAQTMSMHRSTDCGHTWTGPFEITAATNPHGTFSGADAVDAADKGFIDVDPDTSRVLISWSNFTATAIDIRTAFSDNIMSANPPTWSAGVVVDSGNMTGSVPRFAGNGSNNAYVAYNVGLTDGDNIRFSKSTDNGVSWSAPIALNGVNYVAPDYIVGSDRIHSFPSMAVDNSGGVRQGTVYVAAATNNSGDTSDITLWTSTNSGISFTAGTLLDSRPGSDRAQWFPVLAVDTSTGRLNVMYDDQQSSGSGDLMEMTWVYSDNGGASWSIPTPLTSRPFHANYGNDSGQPNIGDYNMGVAQNGVFFAAFTTTPNLVQFTDTQTPQNAFAFPSFLPSTNPLGFARVTTAKAALNLGTVTFTDSGGNGLADAGDQLRYKFPLTNSVTNAVLGPVTYTSVSATLSTTTPGVTIQAATRAYPNIAPGTTAVNTADFIVLLAPSFTPGTRIDFTLSVTSAQATTSLKYTQSTGTPVKTAVFSENFDSTTAGSLPSGWAASHAGGANTVAWTTKTGFCGSATNALFHQNLEDGPASGTSAGNATRFERAFTPSIPIPAGGSYVTLDFDICYNTEDLAQYDPAFPVEAFDGAHLRITDFTPGRAAIAVWAESFAETFTTGSSQSYPKHAPRSNSSAYFQDIPMWAGDSNGFKHVSMKLTGMAGSTVQLRPDYTQDAIGICAALSAANCGVAIDNIVLSSVTLKSDELSTFSLRPVAGLTGVFTGTVTSQAIAPAGGILVNLSSSLPARTTMPASVTIAAGTQTSPTFTVTLTGAGTFTITGTGPSNARSAGAAITN
ncbi:MAG: glycosyl hydrolase, repeat-containing protein [Bryobacterales bacterium]|nr:glycosyl hydrolase, repeat-containing protein [Bryobacterales bacterium]